MKKLLSVFLVVVLLFSMVVPVSADEDTVTVHLSKSMTEQEFRTYTQTQSMFSFQSVRSPNSAAQSYEEGYYYTQFSNLADNTALLGYQLADSGFSKDGGDWVSTDWVDLDVMLGVVLNSAEYEEILEYYLSKILVGIWGCR